VKGGYGHSAVLDELTNKIYVYGGYVSSSSSAAQLTSSLYSFDHLAARWELRTASPSYRYLHSAVVNSGLMLGIRQFTNSLN
jgi:N-acetylneuraminic acid mutarotase